MALTIAYVASSGVGGTEEPTVSGSHTPTSNAFLYITGFTQGGTMTIPPVLTNSWGLTFTLVDSVQRDDGYMTHLWECTDSGSSPGAGTYTITPDGAEQVGRSYWHMVSVVSDGGVGTISRVQTKQNIATVSVASIAATFTSALGGGNAVLAFGGGRLNTGATIGADAGYTELFEDNFQFCDSESSYDLTPASTTVTLTPTAAMEAMGIHIVELSDAAGGPSIPVLAHHLRRQQGVV